MKKILFAALMVTVFAASAFAAPGKEVASIAKNSFERSFLNVKNVTWNVTEDYYKATFITNNVATEAFFDLNGDLIGSSHPIKLEELPTGVKRSFAKKYAGYTVKEAIQFDGVDEKAYYISAENEAQSVILKITNGVIEKFKSRNK